MNILFNERQNTPLCEIMGRYGSDKGHINIMYSKHNYTTLYFSLFKNWRFKKIRLFELGLGTNNVNIPSNMGANGIPGASLYGWSEFFPHGKIFGADIDGNILFNNDKIKTFYCDQTNPHVIKYMWNEPELKEGFDIIVEDGLHSFSANVCFFENSIHKLNRGGYYIIEDITKDEEHRFISKIEEWENKYNDCLFQLLTIPSFQNTYDNNVLIVHKKLE